MFFTKKKNTIFGQNPFKMLNITYDTSDSEFKSVSTINIFNRYKMEINKKINRFTEVSCNLQKYSKQYFVTFFNDSNLFQFSTDANKSYQIKIRNKFKNLVTTYHSVISERMEVFTQLDTIMYFMNHNMAIKLIKPVFEASNLIYIFNMYSTIFDNNNFFIKSINCGMEIVGLDKHVGIGLSGRVNTEDTVTSVNIQRFNLIKGSFYKKVCSFINDGFVDAGIEVQTNLKQKRHSVQGGLRYKSFTTEIKACVNDLWNMGVSWEEKISDKVKICASAEYNFVDFEYGMSVIYNDF